MAWWNLFETSQETRAVVGTQSSQEVVEFFQMLGGNVSASDVVVNSETALQVPAFSGGVNFLSGTMAGLPLNVFRKKGDGREKVTGPLATLLHDAPNEEMSLFDWRKMLWDSYYTTGRGLCYIERVGNRIINIWPLETGKTTVKRVDGRKFYEYRESGTDAAGVKTYQANEIIDIPFMLKPDGLATRSPIHMGKDALGLAIAVTQYGSRYLANGGVPPFAITGNFQTSQALKRASDDLQSAVQKAAKENRQALTMPAGLEIKPIGGNPEQNQMIETQRFCIEQIARLLSLPPVFLQDLTHGTFSNTEQQDLHLTKHTIKKLAEQFEQELNLKLFGRSNNRQYVELNMDGLLRGDFITRMNGNSQAIQTGQLAPNEARKRENLPPLDGGDQLFIQGATVPLAGQGEVVNEV